MNSTDHRHILYLGKKLRTIVGCLTSLIPFLGSDVINEIAPRYPCAKLGARIERVGRLPEPDSLMSHLRQFVLAPKPMSGSISTRNPPLK